MKRLQSLHLTTPGQLLTRSRCCQTVSQGRGARPLRAGAVAAVRAAELVHGVCAPAAAVDGAQQRRPPATHALVPLVSPPSPPAS